MKTGIICAIEREFTPFVQAIDAVKIREKAMLKFYEGKMDGADVVAVCAGVCKVNVAVAAQILIDTFQVDAIINSGTAGGMDERLQIFDVAVSTEMAYHDVEGYILTDMHPRMESVYFHADGRLLESVRAAVSRLEMEDRTYFGCLVTGEAFITEMGRQEINEAFAPLTVDMETASIAHVCYVNQTPFIAIRCVTDTADHSGIGHFEANCDRAAAIAKEVAALSILEMNRNV